MPRSLMRIVCIVLLAAAAGAEDRVFKECPNCSEMIGIPAGRFVMGSPAREPGRFDSEGPQRIVTVKAFALAKYDVTSEEYLIFLRATGYQPEPCNKILNMRWRVPGNGVALPPYDEEPALWPASCISWKDAHAYIDWLNRRSAKPARSDKPQRPLPAAERSRMGIRRPRRNRDRALVGRCHRHRQCQLQRLRQSVRFSRPVEYRQLQTQSVWALRHARQCLAVDGRLLAQRLYRCARRCSSVGGQILHAARFARRIVGQCAGVCALGGADGRRRKRRRIRLFDSRRLPLARDLP
jgi:hypothetical protein